MHVATISVNEAIFDAPLGDDAAVLRELGTRVGRVSAVVLTRTARSSRAISDSVELIPVLAPSRPAGLARLPPALVRLHRRHPIDLIQAQEPVYTGTGALLAAKVLRRPLIVGAFGVDPGDPDYLAASRGHRLTAPLARLVLRSATRVQVDSRVVEQRLRGRGLKVVYKPMTPLNLETFHAAGASRVHRPDGARILFVGRLGRQKDPALLIEAFDLAHRQLPELRLRIVGGGPEADSVRRAVATRGLAEHVTLDGAIAQPELPDLYLSADVLLLTSFYEGLPRVFLEAAATGLPIVSSPVAGALEIAADAPVAIASRSAPALAAELVRVVRDPGWRQDAGTRLRALAAEKLEGDSPPSLQAAVWLETVGSFRNLAT